MKNFQGGKIHQSLSAGQERSKTFLALSSRAWEAHTSGSYRNIALRKQKRREERLNCPPCVANVLSEMLRMRSPPAAEVASARTPGCLVEDRQLKHPSRRKHSWFLGWHLNPWLTPTCQICCQRPYSPYNLFCCNSASRQPPLFPMAWKPHWGMGSQGSNWWTNSQPVPGGCVEVLGSSQPHPPESMQPCWLAVHKICHGWGQGGHWDFIHCRLSMLSTEPMCSQ